MIRTARILGIDPGSRLLGYGLIDSDGSASRYVASGCLKVTGDSLAEKLGLIFRELSELIGAYRPQQLAIENVFMHRNADSALKLGQARGAAICAAVSNQLPVSEYAPRDIWGHDVEHHWYWWRKQILHHLGKTFGR